MDVTIVENDLSMLTSGLKPGNWEEYAAKIALNGFNDALRFGLSLNLSSTTKAINRHLSTNPIYIIGGEDTGDGKFHLNLKVTGVHLSVPKIKRLKIGADFTGEITWKDKKVSATVSISVEVEEGILELTDEFDQGSALYTLYMNAEKLSWIAVDGWKVFNPGIVAKMIDFIIKDKLKRIYLYSFALNNSIEKDIMGKKVTFLLPLPVASQIKLKFLRDDLSVGIRSPESLNLNYSGKESYALASAMTLAQKTGGNRIISAAVGIDYLYEQGASALKSMLKQFSDDVPTIGVYPIEGESKKKKLAINKSFVLKPTDKSVANIEVRTFGVVIGMNDKGELSVIMRCEGYSDKVKGLGFDVGMILSAELSKSTHGSQEIQIRVVDEYIEIHIPWWAKFLKALFFGFTSVVIDAVVKHFLPKIVDKKIEEQGHFDVPDAFVDKAYIESLTFGRDVNWFGPTLSDPNA